MELALPGPAYYPESMSAGADGTIYVGSLATGEIVRFAPDQVVPEVFHAPGDQDIVAVSGVLVDDATQSVWVCSVDLAFANPNLVVQIDQETGIVQGSYGFPGFAFCNDMVLDGDHNLYVSDSFGTIARLADGGDTLETWLTDPSLAPAPGAFSVDGIAWDGGTNIYFNRFDTGELFRVPVEADGTAGALTPVTVDVALTSPDGMRAIDASTLLVVEGAGRLSLLTLAGDSASVTVLSNRLDMPTATAIVGDSAWVTEGQLTRLFTGEEPFVPFLVKRVLLP